MLNICVRKQIYAFKKSYKYIFKDPIYLKKKRYFFMLYLIFRARLPFLLRLPGSCGRASAAV